MFGLCMGKIKFKAKIDSTDEKYIVEGKGIYRDNKIIYQERNLSVTIWLFDNKIEMMRSCNDYKINLVFEKDVITQSTYQIFGGQKVFSLETKTQKLIISDNRIEIDYILEDNLFSYILEMEKI